MLAPEPSVFAWLTFSELKSLDMLNMTGTRMPLTRAMKIVAIRLRLIFDFSEDSMLACEKFVEFTWPTGDSPVVEIA